MDNKTLFQIEVFNSEGLCIFQQQLSCCLTIIKNIMWIFVFCFFVNGFISHLSCIPATFVVYLSLLQKLLVYFSPLKI
jgi:hypothetical protein